jgi:16S rRNA (guanine527-N7)-methyltransferase
MGAMVGSALSSAKIEELLQPYLRGGAGVPAGMYGQLARYLDLLVKWNARTNLTAVREPAEMVRRHFGESLFAGQHLSSFVESCGTVLDFGSGAGFPGLPIQLLRPELKVTLAESQNKKATFLREVVRTLGLATEVWGGRVEAMPPNRRFDVVTMRAVDDMEVALKAAAARAELRLMVLSTERHGWKLPEGFEVEAMVAMVGSESQHILVLKRQ